MYYGCLDCNAVVAVPEDQLTRAKLCPDSKALHERGPLE